VDRDTSLIERKQQQARQRIVRAAVDLFAERGFDGVSVSDIAEAAEVGRTTFFRFFGDKQEVVFAREQELFDALSVEHHQAPPGGSRTAADALRFLQPIVLRLCAQLTSDPEDYSRHMRLVDQTVELRARSAVKMQLVAGSLGELLTTQGWEKQIADLAGQIALACYWTAREADPDPVRLVDGTQAAFDIALTLGCS
jgi:AcrR family transcriptional regulator